MKQNYALLTLAFCLVLSSISLGAQNQVQIQEIKKKSNLIKLEELKANFTNQLTQKKEEALRLAQINNWPLKFTAPDGSYRELVSVTEEGAPIYLATFFDTGAARSTRTDWMHNGGGLGLNIEGQGMTAHIWDGGIARTTHQEYDGPGGENRFSVGDGSGIGSRNFHAAHVTGTVISSGVISSAKGMAPQARGVGYDWGNDLGEMTNAAMNGMLLSNHSYGVYAEDVTNDAVFGAYMQTSRNWDELMYNAPYYVAVLAAGNDGNDNVSNSNPVGGNGLYDKLTYRQTSKNSIVVANGQDANIDSDGNLVSVVRNSGSSEGPTDDLRVKPDIMGNGTGLNSTYETADNAYGVISGTSMASPNVMGSLLLLQQYYNQVNGMFMRASTLKGLALHTADDGGASGPDPLHGWGLMNTKRAAETITNNGLETWIEERVLQQGESYSITVKSDGTNPLQASISWTDLPGQIFNGQPNNSTPVLVNDLDIRVTKDSDTFEPWRLTSVVGNGKGDNVVDPFERIDIDGASGEYTITVTHKGTLADGPQAFALIVTGAESNFTFNTSTSSQTVCSDVDATFDFTYQQVGAITTNFSVQGLPTGASANFSSSSLSDSGTTTLTLSGLSAVPAGDYEIAVIGDDGTEVERRTITLRIYHPNFDNDPMVTTFPLNGETGISYNQVKLQWDENSNAESFLVEVSDNPSFTNLVSSGTETDLDFDVTGLIENEVYYWRIKPTNRCAEGNYSETFSFQTGIEECTNTYSATNFTNATIFDSAGNTASVPIDIPDDLIINRLIVNVDISHLSVEDLTLFIQEPSGLGSNNVILMDGACDDSDDILNTTFDDNGGSIVCSTDSPAITGTIAPTQSLGFSSGKSSAGRWFFAVTDNIIFDGGSIDAASITVCTAGENTDRPSLANNIINVAANGDYTISSSDIEATSNTGTPVEHIYTLLELPQRGNIELNGVVLAVGDTFTQEDINNGLVEFTNTQTQIFTDRFVVDIRNAANGWLPNQEININANVVSADSFELNNFSLFPNPSQGFISVRFDSRTNDTVNVQVFDLQGRAIVNKTFDSNQALFEERITLGNLANGVYLVRVNQGDRTSVKNLIISK